MKLIVSVTAVLQRQKGMIMNRSEEGDGRSCHT